jgi:hypothetical protein
MGSAGFTGQNPDPGPHLSYLLNDVAPESKVALSIVDGSGTTIRELPVNKQPGMYRLSWDMRVGPPLTGPVDTAALNASGRGGRGGGRGGAGAGRGGADSTGRGGAQGAPPQGAGPGGGRGGNDNTFPALPGKYIARLVVTPPSGAPTTLEQSFALTRDPMVTLSDAELKQLYAFRLDVVKVQRTLRDRQAQLDTAQRLFAAAKRAADSSGTKISPELKTQIAAVEKELADITREVGAAAGGRGGAGRGGAAGGGGAAGATIVAGGGRGGRGGRGGAPVAQAGAPTTPQPTGGAGATPPEDEQNPSAPTTPQNLQAKLGTTTEMLGISFNPSPDQKKTLQALPGEIQKQGDRVSKVSSTQLPALIKALKDAGVEVKTP